MQNKDIIQHHINKKIFFTFVVAFVISFAYWNLQPQNKSTQGQRGLASVESSSTELKTDSSSK